MASHNPDGIGEAGRATLRDMAEKHLTPELCEIFVQHLDDFRATGVADPADPTNVLSKLWRLSEHQCPLEIKKSVATAVLKNQTPVDVFFDSLDDPEIFEKWSYGNDENTDVLFKLSCKHAFQSLMALTIAHGREEMTETFKDPVLDRLFLFTDRADRDDQADDHKRFSRFVLEELISIGSSIRRIICAGCSTEVTVYETPGTMGTKAFMRATKADMEKLGIECHNEACPFYTEGTEKEKLPGTGNPQRCPAYNEKTRRLLGYLSWLSHGRRDSEHCPVTKFWDTRDPRLPPGLIQEVRLKSGGLTPLPPRVGNPLDHDLSRLPPGVVHHYRLETCPETKSLFRRARLFSIALKQFILASVGTSVPILAVKVEDGINKTTEGRPRYPLEECMYSGMHPDLDLSLPEVQAAVHAFCCYEMGRSAKALFEYFFLGKLSPCNYRVRSAPIPDCVLIFPLAGKRVRRRDQVPTLRAKERPHPGHKDPTRLAHIQHDPHPHRRHPHDQVRAAVCPRPDRVAVRLEGNPCAPGYLHPVPRGPQDQDGGFRPA